MKKRETETTDVLDGEFKMEQDVILAEEVIPEFRVITLESNMTPFDKRTDIEFDTFYYGNSFPCGLVEVRKRSPRDISEKKWNDRVIWYEGSIIIDGEGRKIAYHVTHEPSANELFPEYFYPTTQYNISRALLSEQDNVPAWKRMVSMKTIQNQAPEPFRVAAPGRPAGTISAYHFVIVNRNYMPVTQDNKKIDGIFVVSPPASGSYIASYRDAIKLMGGSPIGHMRQRAADNAVTI